MILAGGSAGEADVARFRAETEAIASLDQCSARDMPTCPA
jgi:hypothetical protein